MLLLLLTPLMLDISEGHLPPADRTLAERMGFQFEPPESFFD